MKNWDSLYLQMGTRHINAYIVAELLRGIKTDDKNVGIAGSETQGTIVWIHTVSKIILMYTLFPLQKHKHTDTTQISKSTVPENRASRRRGPPPNNSPRGGGFMA